MNITIRREYRVGDCTVEESVFIEQTSDDELFTADDAAELIRAVLPILKAADGVPSKKSEEG